MNIGFVGLGIMGRPMASNLIEAGYVLRIYSRTAETCRGLAALGASLCDSPASVAAESDVFISMLPDTSDVESVLFGSKGAAKELLPGAVVIDMSTISPSATMGFAEKLSAGGIDMLDAPVSGGESGAKQRTLSIMVGGKREVFERCLPILRAMGKNIVHTGPNGAGQKTKLVNQVVGALNLLATVEGIRLARASGLDLPNTLNAVASGAASSWMWANLGPKMIAGDFAPGFSIKLQQKDLRLVQDSLQELGLAAPATSLIYQLFTRAVEMGLGEEGNQALYKLW